MELWPSARVLGIYPHRLGFSYAILEGERRLVDWGTAQLGRRDDQEFRARLAMIIESNRPTLLVCEDLAADQRGATARRRVGVAVGFARSLSLKCVVRRPQTIRVALGLDGRASKHDVADRLIELFPELMRLRPRRRIWQRDSRMRLFEAVALCCAGARHTRRPRDTMAA